MTVFSLVRLYRGFSGLNPVCGSATVFQILHLAMLFVFRVESFVWLLCGFSGLNPVFGCAVCFQSWILHLKAPNVVAPWVLRVKTCILRYPMWSLGSYRNKSTIKYNDWQRTTEEDSFKRVQAVGLEDHKRRQFQESVDSVIRGPQKRTVSRECRQWD